MAEVKIHPQKQPKKWLALSEEKKKKVWRKIHIKRTMTSDVQCTFHFMKDTFKEGNFSVSHRQPFKQTHDADENLSPSEQRLN